MAQTTVPRPDTTTTLSHAQDVSSEGRTLEPMDYDVLGEGISEKAMMYSALRESGYTPDEASLIVYGHAADMAAAALSTQQPVPLSSLPDSVAEASGFSLTVPRDDELRTHTTDAQIIDAFSIADPESSADPEKPFSERVEDARTRWGDMKLVTQGANRSAARLAGNAVQRPERLDAQNDDVTWGALFTDWAAQFREWFSGEGQNAVALLSGTAFPLIAGQQALFSATVQEPWSVARARFNPSFIAAESEDEINNKSMWMEWANNFANFTFGALRGDFLSMATAASGQMDLGKPIMEGFASGEWLSGNSVLEASMAGYGWLGAPQDWDEETGGRWETLRFSADPEVRAQEWQMVRDNAAHAYHEILQHQGKVAGGVLLMGHSVAGASLDIAWDPLIMTSSVPRQSINLARGALVRADPLRGARILGRIAQRTNDPMAVQNYLHGSRLAHERWQGKATKAGGVDKLSETDQLRAAQSKALYEEAQMMVENAALYPQETVIYAGAKAAGEAVEGAANVPIDDLSGNVEILDVPRTRIARRGQRRPLATSEAEFQSKFTDDPSDFAYSDVLAVFGLKEDALLRKHALLRSVRRNIDLAAKEDMPESVLRSWEDAYEMLKAIDDPEEVPFSISRLFATEARDMLDPEDLVKISYLDRHGDTIVQTLDLSEAEALRRIVGTPEDMEFHAITQQSILHGIPIENIWVRDTAIGTYMSASAHMPRRVTGQGQIDFAAINEHNRRMVANVNRRRGATLGSLRRRTQGYVLRERTDDAGNTTHSVVRKGFEGRNPAAIKARSAATRQAGQHTVDPDVQTMPKADMDALLDDLLEIKRLESLEPEKAVIFDYDMFGMKPDDVNIIQAKWKQTWVDNLGDNLARGLWPETYVRSTLGLPDAFREVLYTPREPSRTLGAVFPRMWTRIRNGMNAMEWERSRMTRAIADALEESGAFSPDMSITTGDGVVPRRVRTGSVKKKPSDQKLNDAMYEILDTPPKIYDEAGNIVENPDYFNLIGELPLEARNAVRRIRQTMDFYARKQGIAETDMYITGYISHMFGGEAGAALLREMSHDPDSFILIRHLMDRTGHLDASLLEKNLAQVLDLYASGMSRKLHLEPLLYDLDAMLEGYNRLALRGKSPQAQSAGTWLTGEVNRVKAILRNEPTTAGAWADRVAVSINDQLKQSWAARVPGSEHLIGREYRPGDVGRGLMLFTNSVYASLLTGNPRYAPMSLATGIATTGAEAGFVSTMGGALSMASPETQWLAKASGVDKSFRQIYGETWWRQFIDIASNWHVGTPSINLSEFYVRGITSHVAMDRLLQKAGYVDIADAHKHGQAGNILSYGLRMAEETNHYFGILGKPTRFARLSRSGSIASTQFLGFLPKQTEQVLAMTLRNPGSFFEYMAISGYIQRMAVMELGIDMSTYVGLGFKPDKAEDAFQSAAAGVLFKGMIVGTLWAKHMFGFDVHPMEMEKAMTEWGEEATALYPAATAYKARFAGISAVANALDEDGEMLKLDNEGKLVRPRDLTAGDAFGELPSLTTGLPSVRDRMDKERRDRAFRLQTDRAYAAYQILNEFISADNRGDLGEATKLWATMVAEGMIPGVEIMDARGLMSAAERRVIATSLNESLRRQLFRTGRLKYIQATRDLDLLEKTFEEQR